MLFFSVRVAELEQEVTITAPLFNRLIALPLSGRGIALTDVFSK